ncbi:HAMP domain-containing sensor histidine kinase [Variovorax sp. J22P271]|uniref:sensor histidine kinase n=1 Tax=Variovorax davisae TaxID=3053515 RepID=UPI0025789743|nr:HAMP domain-containing sensor histidine kinase [Variovorax sp. J22P271]MDM0032176.1 HAMP domain-containing sensor histidine kinase [Variovorax sp. J22P271]
MRLADFIDKNADEIADAAEQFAATLLPAAAHLDAEALRDHMPHVLAAMSADLRLFHSADERRLRSLGRCPVSKDASGTASQAHALQRAKAGFDIEQLVAEYRALRAGVLRLWLSSQQALDEDSADEIVRFNDAIDESIAQSVAVFSAEVERWRNVFLGVLGHDLRGPLNAILLTSEVLSRLSTEEPVSQATTRLIRSGQRMKGLLDDLLEFSRASLGMGISVQRRSSELAQACRDELDVLRAALPDQKLSFHVEGPCDGEFDASRVREALGNLVYNAARYARPHSEIVVKLQGDSDEIVLSVANSGPALVDASLHELFEPLRRGAEAGEDDQASLGLGLFIVKAIAQAHGGKIAATSESGITIFTMSLPRFASGSPRFTRPVPGEQD